MLSPLLRIWQSEVAKSQNLLINSLWEYKTDTDGPSVVLSVSPNHDLLLSTISLPFMCHNISLSLSLVFLLPSNELLRIHCIHIDVYMCMNGHEFGIWTMFACECIYVRVITLNRNVSSLQELASWMDLSIQCMKYFAKNCAMVVLIFYVISVFGLVKCWSKICREIWNLPRILQRAV